jgi:cytidyltransferase-like protein
MKQRRKQVAVLGDFDDIRSPQIRFLEEASKFGELTVLVWPDDAVQSRTGKWPRMPLQERVYFLRAVRYVSDVRPVLKRADLEPLPAVEGFHADIWADIESPENKSRGEYCRRAGLEYLVISPQQLKGFPAPPLEPSPPGRSKVIVTGCYDWFHSGHIRFFEEVSSYGDLYVVVGHDANIRALKGKGHPLLPQDERRYLAGSIRYVHKALISTGEGWLDADPEVRRIKPDLYAVNEDGDRGGKREYCAERGIKYLVLKRIPAPGLPKRSSTDLRGF